MSVRIGQILVPARAIERIVHRYCKQIFAHTGHEIYPYRLLGSSTCIDLDGATYVVCCRHQIDEIQGDDVSIVHGPDNVTISASMIRTITADKNHDISDICALRFNAEDYDISNLGSWFFPLCEGNTWPVGGIGKFIVVGYPSSLQADGFYPESIASKAVAIIADYDGPSASAHLHRLKMTRKTTFGSDGLSGGPVFYVGAGTDGYFIGLAGMIQRGSETSEFLHFFDAKILKRIIRG